MKKSVFSQRVESVWGSSAGQWVRPAAGLEISGLQPHGGGRWHGICGAQDQECLQKLRRHVLFIQCLIVNHSKCCVRTDSLLFTALLVLPDFCLKMQNYLLNFNFKVSTCKYVFLNQDSWEFVWFFLVGRKNKNQKLKVKSKKSMSCS